MILKNKYPLLTVIKLVYWVLRTKCICRKARIIRFPFDIRGRKYINLGANLTTGVNCRLEAFSETGEQTMIFGDNIQINDYVHICSIKRVTIGNNVLMASHVYISDNSHGCYKGIKEDSHPDIAPVNRGHSFSLAPVTIGDNVWIGEHVVILPGVTIGKGVVIGANSVVSKDIPEYTIAVGQPAKPIKKFDFNKNIWVKISK